MTRHECELTGEQPGDGCAFQAFLEGAGFRLAYLPGLVKPHALPDAARVTGVRTHEAELPAHEGVTGALQRLEQAYDLGDDVLLTLHWPAAAPSSRCWPHASSSARPTAPPSASGYELRCPECNELHYKDDLQFRCPS